MRKFKIIIAIVNLLILSILIVLPLTPVLAESIDVSSVYQVTDKDIKNGDILSIDANKGLIRAKIPYDNNLFGVLQNQAVTVYRRLDNVGTPVARSGTADINVTNLTGPINAGDRVTSSEIPGYGQKADISGYVIGIALTPFSGKEGDSVTLQGKTYRTGQISVALKIEYAEISKTRFPTRVFDYVSLALFQNVQDPNRFTQFFRYITAGLVVIIGFAVGFFTFSRSVPKTIEALGRNPLAQKTILFSMGINIGLTVATALIAIIAAVFILRL